MNEVIDHSIPLDEFLTTMEDIEKVLAKIGNSKTTIGFNIRRFLDDASFNFHIKLKDNEMLDILLHSSWKGGTNHQMISSNKGTGFLVIKGKSIIIKNMIINMIERRFSLLVVDIGKNKILEDYYNFMHLRGCHEQKIYIPNECISRNKDDKKIIINYESLIENAIKAKNFILSSVPDFTVVSFQGNYESVKNISLFHERLYKKVGVFGFTPELSPYLIIKHLADGKPPNEDIINNAKKIIKINDDVPF